MHQYLDLMRALYFDGITSNFHPDLLRRIGGSLALAARDAHHVRVEEDAFLWLDMRRTGDALWQKSHRAWRPHREAIVQLISQGRTPNQALHEYLRRFNANPHTPQQLSQMMHITAMANGSNASAWMIPTIQMRQRIQRGANVMTDTFGATTTMIALALSARDFNHATPAEWDRAMDVGAVGALVGQMAGAHADARSQWGSVHRTASQPTH